MKIIFSPTAMGHFEYWRKTSPKVAERIKSLLVDISEHPFTGIGKPEPMKGPLQGLWSRRINQEHRLIYKVEGQEIFIYVLSMRYHYGGMNHSRPRKSSTDGHPHFFEEG